MSTDTLSALMILCQGYLAAHMDDRASCPDVDEALNDMGLTKEFLSTDAGRKVRALTNAKVKNKVEDPEWWEKVFGPRFRDLSEKLNEEWGGELPSDVRVLVEAVYERSEELRNPVVVAAGYLAMLKKFRSRSI